MGPSQLVAHGVPIGDLPPAESGLVPLAIWLRDTLRLTTGTAGMAQFSPRKAFDASPHIRWLAAPTQSAA
ncbi:hypothetical protein TgHK011_002120 [Trichoderma gracile]|nr:hypothetical protein TgHK011_002120 [Trichoderma gracile]